MPQPEADFFRALLDDSPLEKEAVALEPETADLLGTPTVRPSDLDQLETEAASPEEPAPPPVQEAPPEEPQRLPEREAVPEEEEPPPGRDTHGGLFSSRRAHPLQMLEVLTERYGETWADWEPETLWWAIRKDFGPVGDLARNKVMALKVAALTDTPWLDWDTFEDAGLAWNDIIPVFGSIQLMTPAQIAFAVQVLRGIRPEDEFANEVSAYMATILEDHGYAYAPEEWFPGAQALLDRREWTNELRIDVEDAWAKVRGMDPTTVAWNEKNPLDVHVLKLLIIERYIAARNELAEEETVSTPQTNTAPPVP